MVQNREANGRTKEEKKKYKRFFIIKKFTVIKKDGTDVIINQENEHYP